MDRADVRLLVVNAGSSSLKLSVLDGPDVDTAVATRDFAQWNGDDGPIGEFAAEVGAIDVVGHRVVHGGLRFPQPVVVDDDVAGQLRELASLAPLHQPRALAAIAAARRALPRAVHIACFDTAFHATLSAAASVYALPAAWRDRWPVRRFGFHGLSHSYASRRAAEIAGVALADLRLVSCHLGAGASLCAVQGGRSVDTTMGFTPLEGLVMATRAGTIDPGLVLWLIEVGGLTAAEVREGLEHGSGLAGLAGTADMRAVLDGRARGDAACELAFDVYAHQLRRELGGMRAGLDGLDLCVFTGGVGEHAPAVRAACGLELDPVANAEITGDGEISAAGASVRTFVVTAREDLEIARLVRTIVA